MAIAAPWRVGPLVAVALALVACGSDGENLASSGVRQDGTTTLTTRSFSASTTETTTAPFTTTPTSTTDGEAPDPPTTTPPTTPAPVTATTVASSSTTTPTDASEPYDFTSFLPNGVTRAWPFPASPPYELVGDPWMDHGDDPLNAHGCVWLIDEAGSTISVVWPERWTSRFVSDGRTARIEIRDELGRVQATNEGRVGIVGGQSDATMTHCRVSDLTFEVIRISPYRD